MKDNSTFVSVVSFVPLSLLHLMSYLPLKVLYVFSDMIWPLIYHFYRLRVTRQNLCRSFPTLNDKELRHIEKAYYRHICDLLVEALYNLRATPKQILKHYKVLNPDLANSYYERGQSVILMGAHYNNWEYMVSSLDMQFEAHGVGVGQPITNRLFNWYLTSKRTRYGTEVVDHTNIRQVIADYNDRKIPSLYMMLSDQSPGNTHRCYWTKFLYQDTGFLFGAEHFARKYHCSVLVYEVKKVKRGYYELTIKPLVDNPDDYPLYFITEKYVRWLENLIKENPQYWLWSHRRWKHKKPADIN